MTISDYVRECETLGEGHLALFDITYDLEHGLFSSPISSIAPKPHPTPADN
jgi:hypothetical protein